MASPQIDEKPDEAVAHATARLDDAIAKIRKTGRIQDYVGMIVMAEGEFRAASQVLSGRDRAKAVLPLVRSADCLRILRQWDAAEGRYREAMALARETGNGELEAKSWFGIEKIHRYGKTDHSGAAEAGEKALALARQLKLKKLELDVLTELADLQASAGNLDKADEMLLDIISQSRENRDKETLQAALFSRGHVLHLRADALIGQFTNLRVNSKQDWKLAEGLADSARSAVAEAMACLEESANLASELNIDFIASGSSQAADTMKELGNSFERSFKIRKQAYLEGIGRPAAVNANPNDAEFLEVRSSLTQNAKHIEMPLLGPVLPGNNAQEAKAFAAALRENLNQTTPSAGALWRHLMMQGQVAETEGDVTLALKYYAEAARLVEKERTSYRDDVSRSAFLAQAAGLFDRLVLLYLSRNAQAEAMAWMERSRARATSDLLAAALNLPTESERRLHSELVKARSSSDHNSEASVLRRIHEEAPQLAELVDSQPTTLGALRTAMAEHPFDLVYYMLYQGRVIAWHIGPQHTHVGAWFAPVQELKRLATAFWESLTKPGQQFDRGAAKDLYFLLAQPVVEWASTKRLVLVLPPELQGLPFQAMLDERDGTYLGEKLALSYAPSASLAARLRPTASLGGAKVLGVVGPSLPEGTADMAVLAKYFPGTEVLDGKAATRSSLKKRLINKNVVHFAAHGRYNEKSPMQSYIEIASESGGKEALTAADMFELPLRNASVVTLAACEAGKVQTLGSSDLYGLTRALLYAGAQNLVLPLWRVDTDAASYWLSIFYREARTQRLPDAVQKANQETRRHPQYGANPRIWSSFVLIGR